MVIKIQFNQRGVVPMLILFAALGLLAFLLISNTFDFKDNLFSRLFPKPSSQAVLRGQTGDLWADIIVGQKDFSEISSYATVPNKLDTYGGAVIDRSSSPQRLYAYDARHHRILGWNWDQLLASTTNPTNIGA